MALSRARKERIGCSDSGVRIRFWCRRRRRVRRLQASVVDVEAGLDSSETGGHGGGERKLWVSREDF
ncbi:hypothetical protein RchiOBHm_Chr6g0302311 [Rosa chinensis]|uniref:Uncharacterized protein n=1 Tax=Rosa chinensis TaxID=74649 RepID=A0A2P6PYY4_ROSCH|nr:hypothetical protein RchiOBHm_Chr6g0302311 [Rosa chinensis]